MEAIPSPAAWLSLMFLVMLTLFNYAWHRDLIYPGFLQAALWSLVLLAYMSLAGHFVPVSDDVFALIAGGAVLFTTGSLAATYHHRPHKRRNFLPPRSLPADAILLMALVIVGLGLFAFALRAYQLASSGPFDSLYRNLRYAVAVHPIATGGFGILAYFLPFSYALAAVAVMKTYGRSSHSVTRLVMAGAVFVALVYGTLSSGRGFILQLMTIIVAIPLTLRVISPIRAGVVASVIAWCVFFVGGVLTDKGGSLQNSLAQNISGIYHSLILYTAGGIPALSIFLQSQHNLDLGTNTFRTVLAALHSAGFDVPVVPLVQGFVNVPDAFNLYTVYQVYVKDFGLLGGLLFQFCFGVLYGLLYKKATIPRPGSLSVFLFSLSMFPLLTQNGSDGYFSLMSTWVQYLVYGLAFCVLVPKIDRQRRGSIPPVPQVLASDGRRAV